MRGSSNGASGARRRMAAHSDGSCGDSQPGSTSGQLPKSEQPLWAAGSADVPLRVPCRHRRLLGQRLPGGLNAFGGSSALGAALLGLAFVTAISPALGCLSDRIGRKPLLAAGMFGLLALTVPAYLLVRRAGPVGLPLGYLMVGAAMSCLVLPTSLCELFPTPVRSTGLAVTYGLASALFGGTAPFLATLLVQRTGNPLVPAYYATAVILAAVTGVLLTKETAFQPLDAEHGARRAAVQAGHSG